MTAVRRYSSYPILVSQSFTLENLISCYIRVNFLQLLTHLVHKKSDKCINRLMIFIKNASHCWAAKCS